jgi:nuclear pore complex protein Nup107
MTRFFAHLCLYLQMIDISVPPLATQVILEAYLQVLEVRDHRFFFSRTDPCVSLRARET